MPQYMWRSEDNLIPGPCLTRCLRQNLTVCGSICQDNWLEDLQKLTWLPLPLTWVPGIRTQALRLGQQVLYLLSHLPGLSHDFV